MDNTEEPIRVVDFEEVAEPLDTDVLYVSNEEEDKKFTFLKLKQLIKKTVKEDNSHEW